MKEQLSVKGMDYAIRCKYGMEDGNGNLIIPREYDAIIKLDNDLLACIYSPIVSYTSDADGLHANCTLTIGGLSNLWGNNELKQFPTVNIDFYSVNGKFNLNKKIIACYYSKANKVLVLFDENQTWSIAYVDYGNHEIIEDRKYSNISEIKEIHDGRFLIKHGVVYKVISLQDKIEFKLPEDIIDAKDYPKGLVIKDKAGLCGFVDYSGETILTCGFEKIEPEEDYIKTIHTSLVSIWSYEGKSILLKSESIFPSWVNNQLLFRFSKKKDIDEPKLYGLKSIEFGNILPPKYSHIEIDKDGVIIYCRDGNWGLARYDEQSHKVIEIIDGYSWIRFSRSYNNQTMVVSKDFMKFNHNGHNQYIIVRKRFRYAIYDTDGTQIRKFRYRCFIPKKDLWMYDYFEWSL